MNKTEQRLIALSVGLALLLTTPLIKIVNQPLRVLGVPVFYMYVGMVWGLGITLLGYIIARDKRES